jgi:hypothetical protein
VEPSLDDAGRRFRTLYCSEDPRTSLREVLAEFRSNAGALGLSRTMSSFASRWFARSASTWAAWRQRSRCRNARTSVLSVSVSWLFDLIGSHRIHFTRKNSDARNVCRRVGIRSQG